MNELGFDPRSIANAIIGHALQRDRALTHLAVQKLLYFTHAHHLVKFRRPLVRAAFEAWEHGPVCRPVYEALKIHGRAPIRELIERRDPFTREVSVVATPADPLVMDHIAITMGSLSHMSPSQLRDLSHVPQGAWAEVWNRAQRGGATLGNTIDDTLSAERFFRLKMTVKPESRAGDVDEASPFAGD
jgi:uncharacterized phage-associated protein